MKLYDLLKSRRSIREFKDQKIEQKKIDLILESALLAPSARRIYPCEFIAITDEDLLAKLSLYKRHGSGFLKGAPLGIVVLAKCELCDTWIEDATIATTFIQLMAQDLGLGSCWIHARERFHTDEVKVEDYIRGILNIPEGYFVESMIAIGYADEEKAPRDNEILLDKKIHYNQFRIQK